MKEALDIQVQIFISIKLKQQIDCQNIQVKLVSNKELIKLIKDGCKYNELWNIPHNTYETLQYFTGELKPYKKNQKTIDECFNRDERG